MSLTTLKDKTQAFGKTRNFLELKREPWDDRFVIVDGLSRTYACDADSLDVETFFRKHGVNEEGENLGKLIDIVWNFGLVIYFPELAGQIGAFEVL